ncbi:MAG: GGDEF domain-containing protein [Nitriliruptoraceae bacterium]|nr:GGDEF domain-containing protein [Nitriliruptoraceae bacterium]
MLVAIAGGTLLWHLVVIESAAPGWVGTGAEAAGFVQVLSLVAVLALLVRTRQGLLPDRRTAATLLVVALLAALGAFLAGASRDAADVVEQYLGARAGLGVAANLLVGIAIMHPSVTAITAPSRPQPDRLSRLRVLLLACAMLVPPGIHVVEYRQGHDAAAMGVVVAWLLLVPTVLARLALLMRAREQALFGAAEADRRLASMLGHTGDLFLLVRRGRGGADGVDGDRGEVVIEYASPAADAVLGVGPAALEGRTPMSLVGPDDHDRVARLVAAPERWPASTDVRVVRADGSLHWCELEVDHYLDDPDLMLVCLRDVDARKTIELRLSEAANRDDLTGLLNRRGLFEQIAGLEASREPGSCIGCITLDLDGFKAINDRLGHGAGDELLRLVARRLVQAVRDGDTVGRPGGDEFVVLCPSIVSLDDLHQLAERILANIQRPMSLALGSVRVGASLGIAARRDGEAPGSLYARSDAALLRAKATGKGRVVSAERCGPASPPRPGGADGLRVDEGWDESSDGHRIVTSP